MEGINGEWYISSFLVGGEIRLGSAGEGFRCNICTHCTTGAAVAVCRIKLLPICSLRHFLGSALELGKQC